MVVFCGEQADYIGAITKLISYCIIGLPVGITLALKTEWRTVGMWAGLAGGSIAQVSITLQCVEFTLLLICQLSCNALHNRP